MRRAYVIVGAPDGSPIVACVIGEHPDDSFGLFEQLVDKARAISRDVAIAEDKKGDQ